MSAMSGLVALLGLTGCDNNENKIITTCDVDTLQVRAVYHQLNGEIDFISFDFYANDRLVATMVPEVSRSHIQGHMYTVMTAEY